MNIVIWFVFKHYFTFLLNLQQFQMPTFYINFTKIYWKKMEILLLEIHL